MKRDVLSKLIDKYHESSIDSIRDYIGASSIGSDCLRQIWYDFKGFKGESVPSNIKKIWDTGKYLEVMVLDWLEKSGLEIARKWYDLESTNTPIFKGHVDAVWTKKGNAYAIIEVKTAKKSRFSEFVKLGVKLWDQKYYAQIQSYMGMSGIFNTYLIVLNKDNSEHSDELVNFDRKFYEKLEERAHLIAKSVIEPPRISNSSLWYQCKMCKFNNICHNKIGVISEESKISSCGKK